VINNPYIIGMIAGVVFSTMVVAFGSSIFFLLIPMIFGSLPVYVAALGWGTRAGIVATLSIVVFATVSANPESGLLIGFMIAVPAALAGHQANLAQPHPDDNGELVWFPISQILFSITLAVIAGVLIFGIMMDFDPTVLGPQLADNFQNFLPQVEGMPQRSSEELGRAFELNVQVLPFVLPSIWIGIHVMNFLLAMAITRLMKVLARPPEDIADGFNLPQIALVMLLVSVAGMTLISPPYRYGFATASGALVMAFSVVGLAALHQRARGWAERTPLLVLTYILITVLFFPVYLFSFSGIMKVARGSKINREIKPDD
jgi:hypothetical protein